MAFFRQSGWMMLTTFVGGVLMYAVHMVAQKIPKDEYSVFLTLLQIVTLMGIPAIGLQTVFTQQAAAAVHGEHERELAGVFRGVLRAIFFIWLFMALLIVAVSHQVITGLKINNPAALWMTVIIGLLSLWMPIFLGLLQGRQNFLWLGWINVVNAIGRFGGICVVVFLLLWYAAGAMVAVFGGILVMVCIGFWQNRDLWQIKPEPVVWRGWLARVVPLTLGLGALQFMLSADMPFVQNFFDPNQTAFYGAAGMIGRALVFFTQPLATVMFPKLVRSAARSEKSDAMAHALFATLAAGVMAALGATIAPSLPLRIVYNQSYLDVATPLVPWFAWSFLPLTLAMVLANALLAHSRFSVVPWLVAIALGYAVALYLQLHFGHGSFKSVIQTLGIFSTLLLAVCAWFTWGIKPKTKPAVVA